MENLDFLRLIGVFIVVIGLMLKLNPLLVVLLAGTATGLVAQMSIADILAAIGQAFITNRYMSIFILSLPVIGLCERYGLKERAEAVIRSLSAATSGRIMILYLFVRQLTVAGGLHIGGHPAMVRPLISPMAEAAAKKDGKAIPDSVTEKIRGLSAASDNVGNFFGQLIFPATGGILLIKGTLDAAGYDIDPTTLAFWAIPTGIAAFIIASIRFLWLDKEIKNDLKNETLTEGGQNND